MAFEKLEKLLEIEHGTIAALLRTPTQHRYKVWPFRRKQAFSSNGSSEIKIRRVYQPNASLALFQKRIATLISDKFEAHPIAYGYVKGRGITSNANEHVGATSALHLDFLNFFGSISHNSVKKSIGGILRDFKIDDIEAIANLCCYRGFLPQGAPSSPILSNLACYPFDEQLHKLALNFGCRVTRYADDITFSLNSGHFPRGIAVVVRKNRSWNIGLGWRLCALIERHAFAINAKKVRFERRSEGVFVTGLAVGDRVTVPLAFRRSIRDALHQCKKYGIEAVASFHRTNHTAEEFEQSLRGCIGYIKQVMGRDDPEYQKFVAAYETLVREREWLRWSISARPL